ncbi:MAG TPA: hypothetical protein VN228_03760 [Pyrinomonadaceae bacterium]|nr:hypothetical protein [Pyrinomonadaceae bacterium]
MASRERDAGRGPRALRLIFSYAGQDVRLVGRQRVAMTVPPSDPSAGAEQGQSGFWFELRDDSGRTLYRKVMGNPIPTSTEVLTDDPARPVAREEVAGDVQGVFVLLCPETEAARTVALFSSPPDVPGLRLAAAEMGARKIAEFDLGEDLGGKEAGR